MSSTKVGPTIASDIKDSAWKVTIIAFLAIFFYIFIRFRKWEYGLGALAAICHDVFFVLAAFTLFHGILPFSLEIDQAFIAAILTIIGYSINDTVVVFDRVRENLRKYKKKQLGEVLNLSINETLSRTVMTSVTTLLALLALYFLGGDVIRGFVFAMIWGVIVGTYSSVFVASTILLWLGVKRDWSKPSTPTGNQFANIDS